MVSEFYNIYHNKVTGIVGCKFRCSNVHEFSFGHRNMATGALPVSCIVRVFKRFLIGGCRELHPTVNEIDVSQRPLLCRVAAAVAWPGCCLWYGKA